jgi:spore maturation protein CgeB
MQNKICILSDFNQYESSRYFAYQLNDAFKRHNVETLLIDANEQPLSESAFNAIKEFNPDFTCSFNAFNATPDGQFIGDLLKIPHISFLTRPSLYFTELTESPYSIISSVDRNECKTLKSAHFERVFFWPDATAKELSVEKKQNTPFEVVFIGSCYDHESLRMAWRARNPEGINKVLDDAIEIVFSNEKSSLAEALVKAWNEARCDSRGVDFATLFTYLDNYTRGKDRVELIRSIKDAKVHVFGELSTNTPVGILGWQHYLADQSNVTVHPAIPYKDSFAVLQQSKIVLNSMPFFRDGTHQRVFTAFSSGCLPVTSESLYLREQFQEEKEILFYQAKQLGKINDQINYFLSKENVREEAVLKGKKKVEESHTWDNRVEELLNSVSSILNIMRNEN